MISSLLSLSVWNAQQHPLRVTATRDRNHVSVRIQNETDHPVAYYRGRLQVRVVNRGKEDPVFHSVFGVFQVQNWAAIERRSSILERVPIEFDPKKHPGRLVVRFVSDIGYTESLRAFCKAHPGVRPMRAEQVWAMVGPSSSRKAVKGSKRPETRGSKG